MNIETLYGISRATAVQLMPLATKVVKVCGGYKGFESISDYETWKSQK